MKKIIILMLTFVSVQVHGQKSFSGEYFNAAGDDGVSDTLFESITLKDNTFTLKIVTRELIRMSVKTGKTEGIFQNGTWARDNTNDHIDISYYRRNPRTNEIKKTIEQYTRKDGEMIVLHFNSGMSIRGIFTSKHYPDMPPMLCLDKEGENLVFANWGNRSTGGKVLIKGK
ncbi:MAG: hypothetical protein JNM41_13100 [Flavipsychrobacter sp.]|nr:hypothetical protein [Flavipsychrobacter sp.]